MSREAPVLILKYDATEMVAGRRRQRREQRRRARRARRASSASSAPTRGAAAAVQLPSRRRPRATSFARAGTDAGQDAHSRRRRARGAAAGGPHRSRHRLAARRVGQRARWRRRSSRRSTPATRCSCRTTAPGSITPRARRRHSPRAGAAPAAAAGAGARRLALPPARLSRPDGVHAERVGSRAGARHPYRRRRARRWSGRGGCCCGARGCRRC